jgi:hypothetical protein
MKKSKQGNTLGAGISRRGFLCASGGMAASAVPASVEAAADEHVGNQCDPRRVTLKDTHHIRTYYAKARS